MVITKTPFRISFFGGGTDYPGWYRENGGSVLSTTIDKYAHISCKYLPEIFEYKSRIAYSDIELVKSHDEIKHPVVRESLRLMGVNDGIEIHSFNDLPSKSGLGSSSSFSVGMLNTLYALKGEKVSKKQLAMETINFEQNILNECVGSQDQVAASFGGFNHIRFCGGDDIEVHPVTAGNERIQELQDHLTLFFTGITRDAPEIAKVQVKRIEKTRKELEEMGRLVDIALDIINDKNTPIEEFGKLLHETWKLKRSLTSKITNIKIDEIYEAGLASGAFGGKLLGAGGGGFVLFFAKPEDHQKIKEKLRGFIHLPFKFEKAGSQVIYYDPTV